jgi:hypothetical protein
MERGQHPCARLALEWEATGKVEKSSWEVLSRMKEAAN